MAIIFRDSKNRQNCRKANSRLRKTFICTTINRLFTAMADKGHEVKQTFEY